MGGKCLNPKETKGKRRAGQTVGYLRVSSLDQKERSRHAVWFSCRRSSGGLCRSSERAIRETSFALFVKL